MKRAVLALSILSVIFGFCIPPSPAAQLKAYNQFSSTATSGTLGPFSVASAGSCVVAFANGGGATFTVQGTAFVGQGQQWTTNTNFGPNGNGIITAPSSGQSFAGSVLAFPVGLQILYSGNTGTISGSLICTDQVTAAAGTSASATPVPCATPTNAPWCGVAPQVVGNSGNGYSQTYPDAVPPSQAPVPIATATTIPVIVGSTTQNTYIFGVSANATGANTASIKGFTGQTTTTPCDTSQRVWATQVSLPSSAGSSASLLGSGSTSGAWGQLLTPVPLVLPSASPVYNYCVTTAGTPVAVTINFTIVQHVGYYNAGELQRIWDALGYEQRTAPWLASQIATAEN
jgi:hypothetical protein